MTEWEALRQECLHCHACTLAETRTNVVFGVGREDAEIMIIGEAPGANEDKQGEPFVGRGGKLLDDMLKMIGLDRSRLYITNSVKCRPPENRDPMNTEKDACKGYLQRQRALMQPKIIVCLGRVSAMEIIRPDFKISQEHGQFFEKDGCLMMALYHPAALLRDPRKKPETFEDLKRLQAKIKEICTRTERPQGALFYLLSSARFVQVRGTWSSSCSSSVSWLLSSPCASVQVMVPSERV